MEGPRPIKLEELDSAIDLSNNVFRINLGRKPTMQYEFPHLYSPQNVNNIIAFVDGDKVISMMAMYYSDILLYGCKLKVSCLGSVCTDPSYRGKGIATKILKKCEEKMENDGIDVCIISGERGLYVNNGYKKIGTVYHRSFKRDENLNNINNDIKEINVLDDNSIKILYEVYKKVPIRFIRNLDVFKTLLKAASYSNVIKGKQKVFVSFRNGIPISYVIYSLLNDKKGQMIEYSGDVDGVVSTIMYILKNDDLESLDFWFYKNDYIKSGLNNGIEEKLLGTAKIINKGRFIDKLSPYFRESLFDDEYDEFIKSINESNDVDFTDLIFNKEKESFENGILNKVLPLEFVWTYGLNYI